MRRETRKERLAASSAASDVYKRQEGCQMCSQTSICTAKRKKSSLHQRFVLRSLDQDLFEEVQARIRDPVFRQKMSERMWKSEGLFAEAKQNHGLSRARYRGRAKVQIQAYMSATAQNLKRLVKAVFRWLLAWWSRRGITTTHSSHILRKPTSSTRPTHFWFSARSGRGRCPRPPYLF